VWIELSRFVRRLRAEAEACRDSRCRTSL